MISATIVNSLPKETWREFVENHPAGNIFHTSEMFEVWERAMRYYPKLWAAKVDSKVVALMIPVINTLVPGMLKLLTSRTIVFGGVLYEKSEKGKHGLTKMLEAYQSDSRWASLFTELRNLSDVSDIQTILKEANFHYEEHLNYLIKLDYSAGDVFGKIGARTRKNIRRGMKRSALDIFEAKDRSQIPACYDLLSQSYKNASVPLPDISLFYAAYEILLPRRMIDFTLAKVNGEAAAVSVELLYKDVVYGWYGGVDRKFGKYVPGEVVMWKVLERSCNQGYQVYDFGGAGKPDEEYGVRDFKAKFGGDLVCFGRNTWTSKPLLLAASELGYSLVRRILFN